MDKVYKLLAIYQNQNYYLHAHYNNLFVLDKKEEARLFKKKESIHNLIEKYEEGALLLNFTEGVPLSYEYEKVYQLKRSDIGFEIEEYQLRLRDVEFLY